MPNLPAVALLACATLPELLDWICVPSGDKTAAGHSYHSHGARYSADIEVEQGKSHFDRARRNPAPFDEPKPKRMRHPPASQRANGSPSAGWKSKVNACVLGWPGDAPSACIMDLTSYGLHAIFLRMPWAVEMADEFEPEFDALHEDVQTEILALSLVVGGFGPQLGRPRVGT